MKKTILITGVAGLLGSRFAEWLLLNQKDFDVIGIDDLSGGYKENIPDTLLELTSLPPENISLKNFIIYLF